MMKDIGAYIKGAIALDPAVITAGAGNDGVEVNGTSLDRNDYSSKFHSAKLVIVYKAVLAEDATLTIAANAQDSANDSDWADYGDAFASAVVATGDTGGSTERGVVEIDLNIADAERYLRAQVTANLSAANTDTVAISAALVFGGADVLPAA